MGSGLSMFNELNWAFTPRIDLLNEMDNENSKVKMMLKAFLEGLNKLGYTVILIDRINVDIRGERDVSTMLNFYNDNIKYILDRMGLSFKPYTFILPSYKLNIGYGSDFLRLLSAYLKEEGSSERNASSFYVGLGEVVTEEKDEPIASNTYEEVLGVKYLYFPVLD